jgi:hypothetical protein
MAHIRRHHNAKQGLANAFVAWHGDLLAILEILLNRAPAEGLAAVLRHIAHDVARHGRGLPDLFLWSESDYRFVEVKAENDHLSPQQFEWLRFLERAGIQAELIKIRRPAASPSAYPVQIPA